MTTPILKYYNDVAAFHNKFDVPLKSEFGFLDADTFLFRKKFINEEFEEFILANEKKNIVEAIDALVDLSYVVIGAAQFMGVSGSRWAELSRSVFNSENFAPAPETGWLPEFTLQQAVGYASRLIEIFVVSHQIQDEELVVKTLVRLDKLSRELAFKMGFTEEFYNAGWDEVQRANMSKVRATSAEQSKRKSSLDVIKPEGWTKPDWYSLFEKEYPQFGIKSLTVKPAAKNAGKKGVPAEVVEVVNTPDVVPAEVVEAVNTPDVVPVEVVESTEQ